MPAVNRRSLLIIQYFIHYANKESCSFSKKYFLLQGQLFENIYSNIMTIP